MKKNQRFLISSMFILAFTMITECSSIAFGTTAPIQPIDPMDAVEKWQIAGQRVNYGLGESSLTPSVEQLRDGAESVLKLNYDFREEGRWYLGIYWTGPPIPGKCESFSFWTYGDASGLMIRVSIEDLYGHWHQKEIGVMDWIGWKKIEVDLNDGADWEPLLRLGEEKQPITYPVTLRRISLVHTYNAPAQGAVYFSELSAATYTVPVDFMNAKVETGREANLFYAPEPIEFTVELTNNGADPVSGNVSLEIEDFFGARSPVGEQYLELQPGADTQIEFEFPIEKIGAHVAYVTMISDGNERTWLKHFAVSLPGEELPPDNDSMFGISEIFYGVEEDRMDTVFQLNRDAGIGWVRIQALWKDLEPQKGEFIWMPETTDEAVAGLALPGISNRLATNNDENLKLTDALSVSFWLKGKGPNGLYWQWPFLKADDSDRRSYGVYLDKDTGDVCFTGGFENYPDQQYMSFSSSFSAYDNNWHHFTITYSADMGVLDFYVDGNLSRRHQVDGGRMLDTESGVLFGKNLNGILDEFLIYDRVLPPDEIEALANLNEPNAAGIVGRWSFDDASHPGLDTGPHGIHAEIEEDLFGKSVRLAKTHGMRTLGILGWPPGWASTAPDSARPWAHMPKLDDWEVFVETITRHYKGVVDHWEIWNEPNTAVFWESPDPGNFVLVAERAYAAAKTGNPDCVVITPGLAGPLPTRRDDNFMEEIIRHGIAEYSDALSIHPYRQEEPEISVVADLEHITSVDMAPNHPLWITEWSWMTQLEGGSTERRSALMMSRGITLALATGDVDRLFWYQLYDSGLDRFHVDDNYGLCYNDLTPKPSYFAYRTCANLLDGAQPLGSSEEDAKEYHRLFLRGDERILAVWRPLGKSMMALKLDAPTAHVVDIMGNEREEIVNDGVLFLGISEAIQFVRGLGPQFNEVFPPVVSQFPEKVLIGADGRVEVALANPFSTNQIVQLELELPDKWIVKSSVISLPPDGNKKVISVDLPPNGNRNVIFWFETPDDCAPGIISATIKVDWEGRTWTQIDEFAATTIDNEGGPVAYWNFDEGSGTIAYDSSENSNNGVCFTNENSGCEWVPGRKGKALNFNVNDLVVIPDSPSLDLSEEVTISFWIKFTGASNVWQFPVMKFLGDQSRNYGVFITPGLLFPCFSTSFEGAGSDHTDLYANWNLDIDEWYHVAATYSQTDQKMLLFVDGEKAGEYLVQASPIRTNDQPVLIGTSTKGIIDEVMIFERALSQDELTFLSNSL